MNELSGRLLSQTDDGYGYMKVSMWFDGKQHSLKVHKLVAEVFLKNPNAFETIDHKDRDKTNNSVKNLAWMSRSDNLKARWDSTR